MARNFYQVTLNGKDIPGARWATRDMARFTLKVEAECTLKEMQVAEPKRGYRLNNDVEWDWADLICREKIGYGEPSTRTKTHVYGIRVGEVGEEKKRRHELAIDYASK